jgi:ribonuclease G
MRREICVDGIPGETRVALLEDGLLTEILIERAGSPGVAGNIYLGRVRTVLPGMQAAFVDIGLERDGFLYVEDVGEPHGGAAARIFLHEENDHAAGAEGEAAAGAVTASPPPAPIRPPARIEDRVREGQELVVQVAKDPMARKGARITGHPALPGRLLVFLPGVDHIGVSRRIEDPAERERLREALRGLTQRLGAPGGFIVRTAATGLPAGAFEDDAADLVRNWEEVGRRRVGASAPALLHAEAGALERALRDVLREGVEEITADADDLVEATGAWLLRARPAGAPRLRRHEGPVPLFEARGIQSQLERALRPTVWLRSGGSIVIHPTEALVAIDVNTGKYVGREGLEETIVRTNLEAIGEIVRQVRLRDLGGIIVIDFIDMQDAAHRDQVLQALEQELRKDRARSRVLQISEFGLVEITRQRTRPSLERLLGRACPTCGGGGTVRSFETLGLEVVREGIHRRWERRTGRLVVRVHPDAAATLAARAAGLARAMGIEPVDRLEFRADPGLRLDQWVSDPNDP